MSARQDVVDLGFKGLNKVHLLILRVSGGRFGGTAFGLPMVELHTIGRKSAVYRSTMLLAPVLEADRIVLVASKGGDDRDPDWYLNLVATPEVSLTISGEQKPFRARTATQEERAVLWPQVVAAYKGYASYQRRSNREIPLVICESRAETSEGETSG